jgi:hypothetical protein
MRLRVTPPVVLVALLAIGPISFAATPDQIDQAISKAKAYIYQQQQPDGSWELVPAAEPSPPASAILAIKQSPRAGQWSGRTALVVYALLTAGENPTSERLAKGVAFLKKSKANGVYALGVRCQVWLLLPQTPDVRNLMKADAKLLISLLKTEGKAKGMYDYIATKNAEYSHSRAQYAVLGLWAAQQAGVEIPTNYWHTVEQAWVKNQMPDGGWSYTTPSSYPETPGMTAAAVATLYEIQDALAGTRGLDCKGNVDNPAITKGLQWLASHSDKIGTTKRYLRDFPFATLYAFERVGVAGGYKYIGDVDWFQKGADWLITTQQADGSWADPPVEHAPAEQWTPGVVDASFAILFMARGRSPLVMNKLQYQITPTSGDAHEAHWNQRPRDVANLVRWISRQTERNLNWQIVNLKAGGEGDLNDAPILYIAGDEPMSFTSDERDRLRKFVEQGGLIYGNADCGKKDFADGFRALGSALFPSYEFRVLPADHLVYRGQQFDPGKWKTQPGLMGLSNGVRELIILAPETDPSQTWTQIGTAKTEFLQMAANLYFYATDKKGLNHDQTFIVKLDPEIKADRTVTLARLQYGGNWDPEPGGWRRLATVLHNRQKLDLKIEPIKLGEGKLSTYKLAHLTGTTEFKLDNASRDELKRFIDSGGTLVVDAAGGTSAFAASVEKLFAELFPGKLQPLPADHALFSAGGQTLTTFKYREFARRVFGALNSPRLRTIELNGRVAVIYSAEDLSGGLVGQNVDGIIGYDPTTATELMTKIVLYASK